MNRQSMRRKKRDVLAEYATLTGSSLVPGVVAKDVDYFALYDTSRIGQLMDLGATYGGDTASLHSSDWGEQVQLSFEEDGKQVEVFFVQKRYYDVLTVYTGLLKELCKNEMFRVLFSMKTMRVLLAETLRAVMKAKGDD